MKKGEKYMFKKVISVTMTLALVMGMSSTALASQSEARPSMTTVESAVENEIDTVLDNGSVSNENQWIKLKDMLGTDYAYFVPLVDENEIVVGYSVISFIGGETRTLVSAGGENAAALATNIINASSNSDTLIYEFPSAFITEVNNSYFKICINGELEEIKNTDEYKSSTVEFLTNNAPSFTMARATTEYGKLTNWDSGKFVPITSGSTTYYGGYQDWLTNEGVSQFYADRSCAVTAASNMFYYMAKNVSGKSKLYNKSGITKTNFSSFQKDVYGSISPAVWGVPNLDTMITRVESFATAKGVSLKATKSSSSWTETNVRKYIGGGLNKNSPVLLLTWNSPIPDLSMHWITITRLYDSGSGTKMVTSNWASKETYDFSTWVNGSSIYKGVIYFE